MKVLMRLRIPEDDSTAIDTMAKTSSRSEYMRKVIDEYVSDRDKLLGMFNDLISSVEGDKTENERD